MSEKTKPANNKISRIKGMRIYFRILLLLFVLFIGWRQWRIWSVPDVGVPFDGKEYLSRHPDEYRIECAQKYLDATQLYVELEQIEANYPLEEVTRLDDWNFEFAARNWSIANIQTKAWLEHNQTSLQLWKSLIDHDIPIFTEKPFGSGIGITREESAAPIVPTHIVRNHVRLMLLEVSRLSHLGQIKEAQQWHLAILKIDRLIVPETILAYLTGISIDAMQADSIQPFLASKSLSSKELKNILDSFTTPANSSNSFKDCIKGEYYVFQGFFDEIHNAPNYYYPSLFFGEPELHKRNQNLFFQNQLAYAETSSVRSPPFVGDQGFKGYHVYQTTEADEKQLEIESSETVIKSHDKIIDLVGLIKVQGRLFDLYLPKLEKAKLANDRRELRKELFKTSLALHIYHRENGRFPETLNELIPGYLTSLSEDRFTLDQPLKYRLMGKHALLWSTATDQKNNDGFIGYRNMWEEGADFSTPVFAPGTPMQEMQTYYEKQYDQWSSPIPTPVHNSSRER